MKLKDFARSGHPPTLLMSFLYFDVSFMVWVLLGVLGAFIAKDFGLTAGQKGFLVAIPILGGTLARIPMGILADRIGAKRAAILGQLAVMVPLAWAWLGGRCYGELASLGLLLGVAGGSFAVALPLASRWYPPEHQGLAMGIAGAGNSGTVISAFLAPRLAEAYGWHAVFGLALIPMAVVLALFTIFAKESPNRPEPKSLGAYLGLLKEPDTLWYCLFYSFTFGGFVGLASFLVMYFHDQYGVGRVTAGNLAALCVFSGSFMRPVGGYLSDRFGGVRILGLLFAAGAAGFAGLAMTPSLGSALSILFLVMAALGLGNGSVFQLVPKRFRKDIGAATGVVGAAGGLGGFFLPSVLGFLKDATGSYGAGFAVLALAGAANLLLLWRVREAAGTVSVQDA
jgi:NNP family nitrate/nitrite transporter-like MFS transporter